VATQNDRHTSTAEGRVPAFRRTGRCKMQSKVSLGLISAKGTRPCRRPHGRDGRGKGGKRSLRGDVEDEVLMRDMSMPWIDESTPSRNHEDSTNAHMPQWAKPPSPGPRQTGLQLQAPCGGRTQGPFSDFVHWKGEAASPPVPRKPEMDRPAGSLSGRRAAVIGWWVIASTLSLPSSGAFFHFIDFQVSAGSFGPLVAGSGVVPFYSLFYLPPC
jgi:hypothetical protein